jgi:predicted HTH domain antitoxin
MGTRTLTLELPEEIVALLGSPEGAAAKARETLVIELLREARIGQGLAAELLGLTRGEILDLMMQRRIPAGPETAEEAGREIEELRRFFNTQAAHGGDQRQ